MNKFYPSFIVIGASSQIGGIFYEKYKQHIILATQNKSNFKNFKKFDITKNDFSKLLKNCKATHAVIFTSENNVKKCYLKKKISNNLNYSVQKKIIRSCLKKNITPIVFSSDYVFCGDNKNSDEKITTRPILEYGIQKKKLEDFVISKKLQVLVLRLSRVFSDNIKSKDFLSNLAKMTLNNKKLIVDKDQFFSPIYIRDVAKLIYILAKKKKTGLFNIAGTERLNRLIITKKIIQHFKLKRQLSTKNINKFNLLEKRPTDVSMNINKIKKVTRYKFLKINSAIKKMII